MNRLHIIVYGSVQGVFFRHNTRKKAQEIGLKGYVRNLPDGSVEIVAEGSKEKLEGLINFCKNNPGASRVTDVKIRIEDPRDEFDNFEMMD